MSKEKLKSQQFSISSAAVILDDEVDVTYISGKKESKKWHRHYEPPQELIKKYFPLRVIFYCFFVGIIIALLAVFIHGIITSEKTHISYSDICSCGYCVEINLTSFFEIAEKKNEIMSYYKSNGVQTLIIKTTDLDTLNDDKMKSISSIISYGKYIGLSIALSMNNLFTAETSQDFGYDNDRYVCFKNGSPYTNQKKQLRLTYKAEVMKFITDKLERYKNIFFSYYFFDAFPVKYDSKDCSKFLDYDDSVATTIINKIRNFNPDAKFGGRNMDGSNVAELNNSIITVMKIKIFADISKNMLNNSYVISASQNFIDQLNGSVSKIGYMGRESISPASLAVAAFISPSFLYSSGDEMNKHATSKTYYEELLSSKDLNTTVSNLLLDIYSLKFLDKVSKVTIKDQNSNLMLYYTDESKAIRAILLVNFNGVTSKIFLESLIKRDQIEKILFASVGTKVDKKLHEITLMSHGLALIQIS